MTANANYKPNEGKREEFRRYLEKTGVMDALTKVFVQLYEEAERPDNAILFIQNAIAKHLGQETQEELKEKCMVLEKKLEDKEQEMAQLKIECSLDSSAPPAMESVPPASESAPPAEEAPVEMVPAEPVAPAVE